MYLFFSQYLFFLWICAKMFTRFQSKLEYSRELQVCFAFNSGEGQNPQRDDLFEGPFFDFLHLTCTYFLHSILLLLLAFLHYATTCLHFHPKGRTPCNFRKPISISCPFQKKISRAFGSGSSHLQEMPTLQDYGKLSKLRKNSRAFGIDDQHLISHTSRKYR